MGQCRTLCSVSRQVAFFALARPFLPFLLFSLISVPLLTTTCTFSSLYTAAKTWLQGSVCFTSATSTRSSAVLAQTRRDPIAAAARLLLPPRTRHHLLLLLADSPDVSSSKRLAVTCSARTSEYRCEPVLERNNLLAPTSSFLSPSASASTIFSTRKLHVKRASLQTTETARILLLLPPARMVASDRHRVRFPSLTFPYRISTHLLQSLSIHTVCHLNNSCFAQLTIRLRPSPFETCSLARFHVLFE